MVLRSRQQFGWERKSRCRWVKKNKRRTLDHFELDNALPPASGPNTPLDCNTMYGDAKYTVTHDSLCYLSPPSLLGNCRVFSSLSSQVGRRRRQEPIGKNKKQGLGETAEPVKRIKDIFFKLVCLMFNFVYRLPVLSITTTMVQWIDNPITCYLWLWFLILTFNKKINEKKKYKNWATRENKNKKKKNSSSHPRSRHIFTMTASNHIERRDSRSSSSSKPMPSSSTRSCQRRSMSQSILPLCCYLMAAMSCWTSVGAGWQDDIQPRRSITLGKLTPPFLISTHFLARFFPLK